MASQDQHRELAEKFDLVADGFWVRARRLEWPARADTRTRGFAPSSSNGCGRRSAPIATPDVIQFAPALPKTRSGKIMRRILRKIGESGFANLGDTSTLADPGVVDNLVANRPAA